MWQHGSGSACLQSLWLSNCPRRGRLASLATASGGLTECASSILSRHCRTFAAMRGSASAAASSIPLSCPRSRRSCFSARAESSGLDSARLLRCVGAAWMAPSRASASGAGAATCGTLHPSAVHLMMPMMRASQSLRMFARACHMRPALLMPRASVRFVGTHAAMTAVSTPPLGSKWPVRCALLCRRRGSRCLRI